MIEKYLVLNTDRTKQDYFSVKDIVGRIVAEDRVMASMKLESYILFDKKEDEELPEGRYWLVDWEDVVGFIDGKIIVNNEHAFTSVYASLEPKKKNDQWSKYDL